MKSLWFVVVFAVGFCVGLFLGAGKRPAPSSSAERLVTVVEPRPGGYRTVRLEIIKTVDAGQNINEHRRADDPWVITLGGTNYFAVPVTEPE